MYKMRLNTRFPRQLHNEPIYVLMTKNNYFGIHLPYHRKDMDEATTKTHLLSFTKPDLASQMRDSLHLRSKHSKVDPLIQSTELNIKVPFRPLHIQKMKAYELGRICRCFWLDMLVIVNIQTFPDGTHEMVGFHYQTAELPAREILIPLLQERLYQSDSP